MKCVIYTQATDPADLTGLVRLISESEVARLVAVMQEVPDRGLIARARAHIRKYGLTSFCYKVFHTAVLKAAAVRDSFGLVTLRYSPRPAGEDMSFFCHKEGLRFFSTRDFSSPESMAFLASCDADLGIVYGTGILKKSFFSIPRLGSINIHKRRLPDYRGGGPIGLWEMLAGEKEIGITVHKVSEKLDGGDIVAESRLSIDPLDTLSSLRLKADLEGDRLIVKSLSLLASGQSCRPQPPSGRTYREPSPLTLFFYKRRLARMRRKRAGGYGGGLVKRLGRFIFIYASLAPLRLLVAILRGRAPVIILYGHLVSDRVHYMGITTENMRRYLQYLRRHYRLVTLEEAVELVRTGKNRKPAVALTFDDGYAENMLCLRAAFYGTGVSATFFVSSAYVGSGKDFSHDLAKGFSGFPPFSWEDLRQLCQDGHVIGSHTRTHVACASEVELIEIEESRKELQAGTGRPVDFFSFPWGKREKILPRAFELTRLAGYKAAFLADSGDAMTCGGDIFRIERTPLPTSGSLIDLEAVLHGWNGFAKSKNLLARLVGVSGPGAGSRGLVV